MKKSLTQILVFSAAAVALVALLMLTAGCNVDWPFSRWEGDTGTVSLSVVDEMGWDISLISPMPLDMTVVEYEVTITNLADSGLFYTASIFPPADSVQIDDVIGGSYVVQIVAVNSIPEVIGYGENQPLVVLLNQMSQVEVDIYLVQGDESAIAVEYMLIPPEIVYDPLWDVELFLTDTWYPAVVNEVGSGIFEYYETDLPAQWGILRSKVYEQGITQKLRWGICEGVLLRTGYLSEGLYEIYEADLDVEVDEGGSVIVVESNWITLVNCDIDTYPSQFLTGVPSQLTMTGDVDITSILWFVNGEDTAETGATASFTFNETGRKMISVVGITTPDGRIGSDSISIPVVQNITTATWLEPDVPVVIPGDFTTFDLACEVDIPIGSTVAWRLNAASAPDILTYVTLQPTSIVNSQGVQNQLINSTNLGNNLLDCIVEISMDEWATFFTAPLIRTGVE